jgi:hypothetical protein
MSNPTDYRALCAELLQASDTLLGQGESPANPGERLILTVHLEDLEDCADRTRTALAQPEPVAPTDDELTLVYAYAVAAAVDNKRGPFKPEDAEAAQLAGLRAVLARYARSAIQPVPVSERLPGPKDCNADGEAWVEEPAFDYPLHDSGDYDIEPGKWVLRRIAPFDKPNNRRWLPHHALPTPTP